MKKEIETIEELTEIPSSELLNHVKQEDIIEGGNALNEYQKQGIKMASEWMRRQGLLDQSDTLLTAYGLLSVPIFAAENSEFLQRLQQEGVAYDIQGYMTMGEGTEAIRYPIVSMTGDVMRFEIFFQKLKHDLKNEI